jgi:ABC-type phosphate transport system permease subunit
MLTLKRDGALMQWAYKWNSGFLLTNTSWNKLGNVTTLCDVFWRSVLITPMKFMAIGLPVGLLFSLLLTEFLLDPRRFVITVLILVLGLSLVVSGVAVAAYCHIHKERITDSMIYEFARGIKNNYCPVVKLED